MERLSETPEYGNHPCPACSGIGKGEADDRPPTAFWKPTTRSGNWRTGLEDYRLYAPFAGHIDGDGAQLYSIVSSGEALLTLTDTRILEISVPLTRDELLQLGQLREFGRHTCRRER